MSDFGRGQALKFCGIGLGLVLLVFLGCVVKYPFPPERDPGHLHYRNLLGVYVKASHYDSCRYSNAWMQFGPCSLPLPFVTLYRRVVGADAGSYRVLGYEPDYWITVGKTDFLGSYAVDRYHFFYGDKAVPGVRPEDVRVGDGFAHDGQDIFVGGQVRSGLDADYTKIAPGFFKSAAGVFADDLATPVPLLDPDTFTFIEDCSGKPVCYARIAEDKNFRYAFRGHKGADAWIVNKKPDSSVAFRDLGCGYYVIDGSAYFGVQRIEGADPGTFTALIVKENMDWCYEGWYARDRQRAYYRGQPIVGADVASFVAFSSPLFSSGFNMFAFDKDRHYIRGQPLGPAQVDAGRHFDRALAEWRSGTAEPRPDRSPDPLGVDR